MSYIKEGRIDSGFISNNGDFGFNNRDYGFNNRDIGFFNRAIGFSNNRSFGSYGGFANTNRLAYATEVEAKKNVKAAELAVKQAGETTRESLSFKSETHMNREIKRAIEQMVNS